MVQKRRENSGNFQKMKKSYVLFRMWKKFELIPGATGKPTGILKIFYTN